MRRLLAIAFLSAPLLAPAADPPKGGGRVELLVVKLDGDKMTSSVVNTIPKTVAVTDKDGVTKTIQVTETVATTTARDLKLLKATDADGKEVSADDLKARLKDGGLVAFLSGPLDVEWRKKFKGGVVFVEYAAPKDEKKGDGK